LYDILKLFDSTIMYLLQNVRERSFDLKQNSKERNSLGRACDALPLFLYGVFCQLVTDVAVLDARTGTAKNIFVTHC